MKLFKKARNKINKIHFNFRMWRQQRLIGKIAATMPDEDEKDIPLEKEIKVSKINYNLSHLDAEIVKGGRIEIGEWTRIMDPGEDWRVRAVRTRSILIQPSKHQIIDPSELVPKDDKDGPYSGADDECDS